MTRNRALVDEKPEIDWGTPRTTRAGQRVTLLGHQALKPTLVRALESAGIRGQLATVTAGWQERESEDQELNEHVGGRSVNLRLYERAEKLEAQDPRLFAKIHERQARLRELQLLYDVRLRHAMEACKDLELRSARGHRGEIVEFEMNEAMRCLRALDAEHLQKIAEIHADYDARLALDKHAELQKQRAEIARLLSNCEAIGIAGGHVAVLLNRLNLFGIPSMIEGRPVFAWSAGAIVVCQRIVLFHDTPPQGPGNAEVLESGLGLIQDVVALPHAHRRLLLEDTVRVSRFVRRFAPAKCVALEDGGYVRWCDDRLEVVSGARVLFPDGSLQSPEAR